MYLLFQPFPLFNFPFKNSSTHIHTLLLLPIFRVLTFKQPHTRISDGLYSSLFSSNSVFLFMIFAPLSFVFSITFYKIAMLFVTPYLYMHLTCTMLVIEISVFISKGVIYDGVSGNVNAL